MIAVIAVGAVAALTALALRKPTQEPFAQQLIVAATLELYGPPSGRAAAKAEIDNAVAVQQLTEMLESWLVPRAASVR